MTAAFRTFPFRRILLPTLLAAAAALLCPGGAPGAPPIEMIEPAAGGVKDEMFEWIIGDESPRQMGVDGYRENEMVLKLFAAMQYRFTGGRFRDEPIRFRMHFPSKILPGKKYPLIMWLHGAGESGTDNHLQLAHMQKTAWLLGGRREIPCFIIATQCPIGQDWDQTETTEGKDDSPLTIAEEILRAALVQYPIDPDRVVLYGICSGGSGALRFIERCPGTFAAVGTCSTAFSGNLSRIEHAALWGFQCDGDGDSGKSLQKLVDYIDARGGAACLTILNESTHDSWTASMHSGAVGWLLCQNRSRCSPPPGEHYRFRSRQKQFRLFGLPALAIAAGLICRGIGRSISFLRHCGGRHLRQEP